LSLPLEERAFVFILLASSLRLWGSLFLETSPDPDGHLGFLGIICLQIQKAVDSTGCSGKGCKFDPEMAVFLNFLDGIGQLICQIECRRCDLQRRVQFSLYIHNTRDCLAFLAVEIDILGRNGYSNLDKGTYFKLRILACRIVADDPGTFVNLSLIPLCPKTERYFSLSARRDSLIKKGYGAASARLDV